MSVDLSPHAAPAEPAAFTIAEVIATPPTALRRRLPRWLSGHAIPAEAAATAARVADAMAGFTDAEVAAAVERYAAVGAEYRLYPAEPVARAIGQAFVRGMARGREVSGVGHLRAALHAGPSLLVCNHLSYSDSQFTDLLLDGSGAGDLASRLVYIAGPKVYESPARRMAALGLSTLPTAQSSRLGAGGEHKTLSPREIARIALGTVAQAGELMAAGSAVVLYAEGSRSRSGRLGSFLRAGARYAGAPGTRIVPLALSGSDRSFPVHRQTMEPADLRLAIGPAVEVGADRQAALEEAWHRIAALLPPEYRPEPATAALV